MIPEDVSDETKVEVLQLLKPHKLRCQFMLTFRYIPRKYTRTKAAQFFYISIVALLLFWDITIDLPTTTQTVTSYVLISLHVLTWLLIIVSFLLASCTNPGYLEKQY